MHKIKKLLPLYFLLLFYTTGLFAQTDNKAYGRDTGTYTPSHENLKTREWFANAKFGMFIHWGLFSLLGGGEWVMYGRKITVKDYTRLEQFFNPVDFDAHTWVSLAKNAGMKYITLVTRHHDGFSLWDTKYSNFNIMNTPYKKDIVKQIADECHKQGIKLAFYYSLLDWHRDDYSWWTGTGEKNTGRTVKGKWEDYIQFMKNQLTELLTNYGEVTDIWFDGYWNQLIKEGVKGNDSTFVDWHMKEIYELIHKLQPACMVGNNHHLAPLPGEDFQMFESHVPGEGHDEISRLPLESCNSVGDAWGFNISDKYKTHTELIALLVKSAAPGGNLLLNIGPMPNGAIQPEYTERLLWMGNWLKTYGESIYNTKGGYIGLQKWGCITQTNGKVFVHVLKQNGASIKLEAFPFKKIIRAYLLKDNSLVNASLKNEVVEIPDQSPTDEDPDQVVVLEIK